MNILVATVDSWLLMGSPTPLLIIFTFYLLLVLRILPKFMKSRAPYKLDAVIKVYNIFQILASTAIVLGVSDKKNQSN